MDGKLEDELKVLLVSPKSAFGDLLESRLKSPEYNPKYPMDIIREEDCSKAKARLPHPHMIIIYDPVELGTLKADFFCKMILCSDAYKGVPILVLIREGSGQPGEIVTRGHTSKGIPLNPTKAYEGATILFPEQYNDWTALYSTIDNLLNPNQESTSPQEPQGQ